METVSSISSLLAGVDREDEDCEARTVYEVVGLVVIVVAIVVVALTDVGLADKLSKTSTCCDGLGVSVVVVGGVLFIKNALEDVVLIGAIVVVRPCGLSVKSIDR